MPGLYINDHPGPGPLVVLVHGSMDRSLSFAKVMRQLGDLHCGPPLPALVDRHPGRDPVSPRAQVAAVLETLVPTQGPEERFLEGVVGRIAACELAEV